MRRLGVAMALVASLGVFQAAAQELPPALKVDLVVPATLPDEHFPVTDLCVYLPEEAATITVAKYPLVAEAGSDRPLYMSIRPYVSTAFPLVERVNVAGDMSLTIPELGYETCFSFENQMYPREMQGVAQGYKYFAQVVHLEVR